MSNTALRTGGAFKVTDLNQLSEVVTHARIFNGSITTPALVKEANGRTPLDRLLDRVLELLTTATPGS